MFFKKNKLLIIIIIIGAILRFYKLDWASGLFTHPDEYHIVSSVSQLSFPNQMHPHFFSYGTVTIYLIYFTQELIKFINHSPASPQGGSLIINPFLIGRFYSALFSTLTIYIVYKICIDLFARKQSAVLVAILIAITPGLIQQAHFATPESAQIFFLFGSLLFAIKFLKQNKILNLIFASIFLGLSLGAKVSSVVFLLPLTITAAINSCPKNLSFKMPILFIKQIFKGLLKFVGLTLAIIIVTASIFALVAPFVFLDFPAFRGNLEYEGGLAIGIFQVFYTRQFIDTIPVLFQIEKILPYALGPFVLLFSSIGFVLIIIESIRQRKMELIILILAFLSLFLTNAFLFAKWTRFISPTLPFYAIFSVFLVEKLYSKNKLISKIPGVILFIGTFLWTAAFFSIYLRPDVRITASNWIEKNFPENSTILVEGGNMIDVPLGGNFNKISLDFYNLGTNIQARSEISSGLERSNYFLIQSRRVFMNHQRLPEIFPKTASFYDALFNGSIGFEQIKEFHSYPILKLGRWKIEFPDEKAEETWSTFDHPVIRIFKKTQQLSVGDYGKIFED